MKYNICQIVAICGNENNVGAPNPSDEPFSKTKKRKTEGRLNNLLNRIRSNTLCKTGNKTQREKASAKI